MSLPPRLVEILTRHLDQPEALLADGVGLLAAAVASDSRLNALSQPFAMSTLYARSTWSLVKPALDEHQICHAVLKGPALAAAWTDAWGVDARTFTDIDVLVAQSDVPRVRELLVDDLGFSLGEQSVGEITLTPTTGEQAALDLHWLAINDATTARRYGLAGSDVLPRLVDGGLSPDDLLLQTCLHALASDASRLGPAVDVAAVVISRAFEPSSIKRLAAARRCALPLAVMLDRAAAVTGDAQVVACARALPKLPWRLAVRRFERGSLPASGRRWSGGEALRHTRSTSAASFAALLTQATPGVVAEFRRRRSSTQV